MAPRRKCIHFHYYQGCQWWNLISFRENWKSLVPDFSAQIPIECQIDKLVWNSDDERNDKCALQHPFEVQIFSSNETRSFNERNHYPVWSIEYVDYSVGYEDWTCPFFVHFWWLVFPSSSFFVQVLKSEIGFSEYIKLKNASRQTSFRSRSSRSRFFVSGTYQINDLPRFDGLWLSPVSIALLLSGLTRILYPGRPPVDSFSDGW